MIHLRRIALSLAALAALAGICVQAHRDGDAPDASIAPSVDGARAASAVGFEGAEALRDRWGVEPTLLALSAAGSMIDLRYRVIDAEKARPLLDRSVKPVLIDEASGARLIVPEPPKVGMLRSSSPPREGLVHFVLFANPGKLLKAGASVTVEIGDFSAAHMVIDGG